MQWREANRRRQRRNPWPRAKPPPPLPQAQRCRVVKRSPPPKKKAFVTEPRNRPEKRGGGGLGFVPTPATRGWPTDALWPSAASGRRLTDNAWRATPSTAAAVGMRFLQPNGPGAPGHPHKRSRPNNIWSVALLVCGWPRPDSPAELSLRGNPRKGFGPPTETNVHGDALCFNVMGPSLLQRLAVGGWRLAVGGGWRLVAVGGWWRLAAVGGWRLAVPGGCP